MLVPWLQLYASQWRRRQGLTVQVEAQELAPIRLKPGALKPWHQPGLVHAHTRAFDPGDTLLADSVHGGLQERLSHRAMTPFWRYHEAGKNPEVSGDHVIRVAYRPRPYAHRLTWHTAALHDTPQRPQRIRNIPPELLAPPVLLVAPEPLKIGGRDGT